MFMPLIRDGIRIAVDTRIRECMAYGKTNMGIIERGGINSMQETTAFIHYTSEFIATN